MSTAILLAGLATASLLLLVERAWCLALGPLCRSCRYRWSVDHKPRARRR